MIQNEKAPPKRRFFRVPGVSKSAAVDAVDKVDGFYAIKNHRPAADCLLTERIKLLIFPSEGGIILITDNINGIKGEPI